MGRVQRGTLQTLCPLQATQTPDNKNSLLAPLACFGNACFARSRPTRKLSDEGGPPGGEALLKPQLYPNAFGVDKLRLRIKQVRKWELYK